MKLNVTKLFKGSNSKREQPRQIKLRTLLLIFNVFAIICIALLYFWYYGDKSMVVDKLPGMMEYIQPRYRFSIYGAKGVKLVRPMSVYFDEKLRRIYISNTEGHSIDVFNWQGDYQFSFGGFGADPGQMSFPYGITQNSRGDILVSESGNKRVQRFSNKGEYLGTIFDQPNEYGIEKPGPLASDAQGNLYIGDLSGGKVTIIDKEGQLVRNLGPVQYPHGLALDEKRGLLYVASSGTNRITAYSLKSGKSIRSWSEVQTDSGKVSFGLIRGIAVDKQGRLVIVDSLSSIVSIVDFDGNLVNSFGQRGNEDWSFMYPNGIHVSEDGKFYLADWGNNRISMWSY